jgi:hypothetical protein
LLNERLDFIPKKELESVEGSRVIAIAQILVFTGVILAPIPIISCGLINKITAHFFNTEGNNKLMNELTA